MQKVKLTGVVIILAMMSISCNNNGRQQLKTERKMKQKETKSLLPTSSQFVSSPLRNRVKLELNASVDEVWKIIGRFERMPEYSIGLHKVDAKYGNSGNCTEYTCYFFPEKEGDPEATHREIMKWYETNVGYASSAEEPNAFGYQQSLGLVTLESHENKTILTWDIHFNAENDKVIKMNVAVFEQSLNHDIAQNLIKIFGGRVLENYIEKKN